MLLLNRIFRYRCRFTNSDPRVSTPPSLRLALIHPRLPAFSTPFLYPSFLFSQLPSLPIRSVARFGVYTSCSGCAKVPPCPQLSFANGGEPGLAGKDGDVALPAESREPRAPRSRRIVGLDGAAGKAAVPHCRWRRAAVGAAPRVGRFANPVPVPGLQVAWWQALKE